MVKLRDNNEIDDKSKLKYLIENDIHQMRNKILTINEHNRLTLNYNR
jgi:hypothetical protein